LKEVFKCMNVSSVRFQAPCDNWKHPVVDFSSRFLYDKITVAGRSPKPTEMRCQRQASCITPCQTNKDSSSNNSDFVLHIMEAFVLILQTVQQTELNSKLLSYDSIDLVLRRNDDCIAMQVLGMNITRLQRKRAKQLHLEKGYGARNTANFM